MQIHILAYIIYKDALLKSAIIPPKKISPEESARKLIENFEKLEEYAHIFGSSFILFYILLLIFPAFSGMDLQSSITKESKSSNFSFSVSMK